MTGRFDFRVLGPVRVLCDGVEIPLGGSKRRSLLALLIANRNRVVSVSSIADALWGDDPPPSVASSIQVAVSGLRAALAGADETSARTFIETAPPGYRLVVDDSACDIGRFKQLRELAIRSQQSGRLAAAATAYCEALDEWSGAAYEDLLDLRFAAELAVALDEQRLATIEARIEVDLAAGKHRELVGELATLTSQYPLRESLWTAYMTALFRCGRQADALAAFRLLRTTLMDELGLDPSVGARELERAILAQDPALAWKVAGPDQPAPALTQREAVEVAPAHLRDQNGSCTPIDGSGLQIGRLADNSLVIDDPKVSRYHASIVATSAGYVITDLHSTNGTRLDGVLVVGPELLHDGNRIAIGTAEYEFRARPSD
ncbi:MAG: BTAD domain-containing putative transcriptional regulator [Actinomycetota bacterium]